MPLNIQMSLFNQQKKSIIETLTPELSIAEPSSPDTACSSLKSSNSSGYLSENSGELQGKSQIFLLEDWWIGWLNMILAMTSLIMYFLESYQPSKCRNISIIELNLIMFDVMAFNEPNYILFELLLI